MRLAEMYAAMRTRFPVYVMVTKTDMLAGFTDFFGDLDSAGRAQVWGTTFALDIDPAWMAEPYAADFAALEARLGAEMLARLQEIGRAHV